jgi:phosphate transport system permease protein
MPARVSSSRSRSLGDRVYRPVTAACAAAIPAVLALLAAYLLRGAWPVLSTHAGQLLTSSVWDVPRGQFGALPVIGGTLLSSLLALLIAAPLAISVAILSAELAPRAIREPLTFLVNLLAAIPSVVYGLWGIYVLLPLLRRTVMPGLMLLPGSLFRGPAYGPSLLAATLLLSAMILPFIAGVSRDVLLAVPRAQREAALALGATRWEMIRDAVLPAARPGLFGGIMLGLGRALGETMAVTMVIGNRHALPSSLLDPTYTMASLLANEFAEASNTTHLAALLAVATILLALTLLVNVVARVLVARVERGASMPGRWA